MDGADQAAILILRSCSYATACDQEAYDKEKSGEILQVLHGTRLQIAIKNSVN
jgi:hypothetical protein